MARSLDETQIQTVRGALDAAAMIIRGEREIIVTCHCHLDHNGEPRLETLDESARSTVAIMDACLRRIDYALRIVVGPEPSPEAAARRRVQRRLSQPSPSRRS